MLESWAVIDVRVLAITRPNRAISLVGVARANMILVIALAVLDPGMFRRYSQGEDLGIFHYCVDCEPEFEQRARACHGAKQPQA
jgi:hypothetical protein